MLSGLRAESWEALARRAEAQGGFFSLDQAARCGISKQLLYHHRRTGRVRRVWRGVYRMEDAPEARSGRPAPPAGHRLGVAPEGRAPSEGDRIVLAWLATSEHAIVSHCTALEAYGVLPPSTRPVHLTLPRLWIRRRMRPVRGVVLHFEDLEPEDRCEVGGLPVVCLERAFVQCFREGMPRDQMRAAMARAARQFLLQEEEGEDPEPEALSSIPGALDGVPECSGEDGPRKG